MRVALAAEHAREAIGAGEGGGGAGGALGLADEICAEGVVVDDGLADDVSEGGGGFGVARAGFAVVVGESLAALCAPDEEEDDDGY